ncbi:hypothetical protein MMC29_006303 [Sticta canariensis]|nr:hypothetical protein [Sticta canariensis]
MGTESEMPYFSLISDFYGLSTYSNDLYIFPHVDGPPVQSLSTGLASFIREYEEAAKTKDVAQNEQAIDKSLRGTATDLTEAVEILDSREDDLDMEATIMETDECSRYLQQRRMHRLRRGQFLLGHYDANASNNASPKRWIPAPGLSGE